jgi:hypothetical protein
MSRAAAPRPSLAAIGLGLIPFVAICGLVPLWDRITPRVFGLPFNLAWLIAWIVLTPLCLNAAHRVELAREAREAAEKNGGT